MSLNIYLCWVSGQKARTIEVIVAAASIDARAQIARKYRLAASDCVAQRQEPTK